MRSRLIAARREKGYTQRQLAKKLGVRQDTISSWETGKSTPESFYIPKIRDILECDDPLLFDNDSPVGEVSFKDIIDMIRRQFVEKLGTAFGLSTLFNSMSLALVSTPNVSPEEYLALVEAHIGTWKEWYYHYKDDQLIPVLNANEPILKRLAQTLAPYSSVAASLLTQVYFMKIGIATYNRQFGLRELLCGEAVHFGALSGDRNLYALASYWHGDTYTYCYSNTQKSVSFLKEAYSYSNESPLLRTRTYLNLALANIQDENSSGKLLEKCVLDYVEKAGMSVPVNPRLDPIFPYSPFGTSELCMLEGKVYLHLAERLGERSYARRAYETSLRAIRGVAIGNGYFCQAIIQKANAARVLGNMRYCIHELNRGFELAARRCDRDRLTRVYTVLQRMPASWHKEAAVQELQKDVMNAIGNAS